MEDRRKIREITIFSTLSCSFCKLLMKWLDKEGIPYTKKMTDQDEAALSEFMSVNDGALGVPFSVITLDSGEEIKIAGFDKSRFKAVLGL